MVKTVMNVRSAFMLVLCVTIPFTLLVLCGSALFCFWHISLQFVQLVHWLFIHSSGGRNYLLLFPWPLNLAIKLNAPRYSPSSTPILVGKRLWQRKARQKRKMLYMHSEIHTHKWDHFFFFFLVISLLHEPESSFRFWLHWEEDSVSVILFMKRQVKDNSRSEVKR